MRGIVRPLIVVTLVLLVPILPFLSFGDWLEARIESWFEPPPPASTVALLTVVILASDIVLPVPSSVVSTVAGAQLGVVAATAASWLGMTLGAIFGFYLVRTFGRSLAVRFSSPEDLGRTDDLSQRYGSWLLVITRPLPVLAEAAVLLVGTTHFSWGQFLPPVMLSNLGIAAVYSVLGRVAQSQGQMALAVLASIALPLAGTTMARWRLRR